MAEEGTRMQQTGQGQEGQDSGRAWSHLDSLLTLYVIGVPVVVVLWSVRWWYPFPILSCLAVGAGVWHHLTMTVAGTPAQRLARGRHWAATARGSGIAALALGITLLPASVVIAALTEFKLAGPELMTPTLVHPWGIGHACRVFGILLILWGGIMLQSGREVGEGLHPAAPLAPPAPLGYSEQDIYVAVGFITLMASMDARYTMSQRLSSYLETAEPAHMQRTWTALRAVLMHWGDGPVRTNVLAHLQTALPRMDANAAYEALSGYDRLFAQVVGAPSNSVSPQP